MKYIDKIGYSFIAIGCFIIGADLLYRGCDLIDIDHHYMRGFVYVFGSCAWLGWAGKYGRKAVQV